MRRWRESGIGVLLIEQFATLALSLARRAYVMEGARLLYSGLATELREHPDLPASAYLLRGDETGNGVSAATRKESTTA